MNPRQLQCDCGGRLVKKIELYMRINRQIEEVKVCEVCNKIHTLDGRPVTRISKKTAYLYQLKRIIYL